MLSVRHPEVTGFVGVRQLAASEHTACATETPGELLGYSRVCRWAGW